ncbi:hypothetical protein HGRIS_009619 [Hohenbuehelia grisea]|uniref:DNA-directed RNA polymerase III subunit RPC6 n=1 Tax=Hohenbuehelia grisea TaxID=104357 RepID=A0ABR3J334_9AGAR
MSKRPPNELESKLHQAALSAPKQELSAKQAEALIPNATARQNALNFLLGGGLLKALKTESGSLIFRAVSKGELDATKDLSGEEALVLNHISGARNEGIWTKQLKAKTNLHQTVIDRCIKTLTQKKMIKRVQSVQHPTRKIFMLEHLEPSIALTGGPWYSDSELDTEFIKMLLTACMRFIQDKSYPKRRSQTDQSAFYPISNSPKYPTAQNVRAFLKQSRITETDLTVEHVEMLLNVLVLDGEIEKLPAFGATLWDSSAIADDASDDEDSKPKKKKKRKRDADSDDESSSKSKRKKKRSSADNSDDSDDESEKKSKRSKSKSKKRSRGDDGEDSDDGAKKRKKKKKKRDDDSDDDSSSASSTDSEAERRRKRKKAKKRKKSKKRAASSDSDTASSSSSSESDSEDERARRKRKAKLSKRSPSPDGQLGALEEFALGSANVYRAIKQERLALGWSQAPCAECPSFEFCKPSGPVNPQECVYYGDWLAKPVGGEPAVGTEAPEW